VCCFETEATLRRLVCELQTNEAVLRQSYRRTVQISAVHTSCLRHASLSLEVQLSRFYVQRSHILRVVWRGWRDDRRIERVFRPLSDHWGCAHAVNRFVDGGAACIVTVEDYTADDQQQDEAADTSDYSSDDRTSV